MNGNTVIKTTKLIYPQIYAYITPNYHVNDGWIKRVIVKSGVWHSGRFLC